MPGKLTARTIASLTLKDRHTPGRHTDGDGLHLHIRPNGNAAWVLRYRFLDKQSDLGLGGYPEVGLAEARSLARDARDLIAKGLDPKLERQRARSAAIEAASPDRSFQGVADAFIAERSPAWKSTKHAAQWTATLKQHVHPELGTMPVSQVDTEAVLRVLRLLWTRTPETASRLRGRIEAVLDFARARGWRAGENPARWRGHLAELLPSPRKVRPVEHQPALPWQEVPAFLEALARHRGMTALALRFLVLTAARSGEVREMRWGEVDEARRIWTIPAARMKAKRLHRVPLSAAAMAVLEEVRPLAPEGPERAQALVFPGGREGRPLSDMGLSMLLRGMSLDDLPEGALPRWRDEAGRAVVPHGFRSSFRGWTRAQGWPDHLGEMALAHVDKDRVRAAYARDDLLEERRPMMEAWGELLQSPVARGDPGSPNPMLT